MTRKLAVVLLLLAVPLTAQDLESHSGMNVRFDAPGARARSMGGASLALGDVFGAATNPAAIASTTQRIAAIEGRYTSSTSEHLTDATLPFTSTTRLESSRTRLNSALVVIPTSRGVYSIFYDEPLAARHDTRALNHASGVYASVGVRANGELVPFEGCSDCLNHFFSVPTVPRMDAEVTVRRVGTAGAWKSGNFALGAAVRYEMLDERSTFHSLMLAQSVPGTFADDSALSWNVGMQWQAAPSFRAGASWQSGASLDADRGPTLGERTTFDVPETFGAGVAFEPVRNLTIAADALRVRYSDANEPVRASASPFLPPATFVMPDVTELHAGAEYRLGNVALRAGWWRDPAHRIRAEGDVQVAAALNLGLLDADEDHVTAGIGFGLSDRVRLDAAIDRGDRSTRASVAVATTF
jgi:hypothetical protein